MNPRVTLVTFYYNRSAFVDHSMASLRDQTYSDLKIIAVDDGSPDDTLQRLEKFKDGRIDVRGQANRGFTPTMRSIFDAVDTEFVAVHGPSSGYLAVSPGIDSGDSLTSGDRPRSI